jgi:hypothetical protein
LDIDGTSVPDIHNMSLEDSFDFTPLNYDDDEDDNNESLLNNLNFEKLFWYALHKLLILDFRRCSIGNSGRKCSYLRLCSLSFSKLLR